MSRSLRVALLALIALSACAAPAAAGLPANADWKEYYIKDSLPYPAGQPTLHADLLTPKGAPAGTKFPVIVSVGPYFNHSGSTMLETPDEDGPQLRWNDLIQDGKVFERGYALLQVDLRGFGGSQGCNDFGGPGEQNDVFRAVEWAAKQPWSTGSVAIFGKSYDAWTGVMALNTKPKGLGAAIIQSPIIDGYRTLYQDGVHYNSGWYLTPGIYQADDAMPPSIADFENLRTDYLAGWATGTNPACYAANIAMQDGLQNRDDAAGFWKARDLDSARGSNVPTFWTHGFLDVNTKPDNFESVWSSLTGPKHAWFGQFIHTRPNEPGVGRNPYFYGELFNFLDEHLRGAAHADVPTVEVENSDGKWRGEAQWPPADGVARAINLKAGSYADRPDNAVDGTNAANDGVWSITAPLTNDAWIAGVTHASVKVTTTAPNAVVIARLYDIDSAGTALLITHGAGTFTGTGSGTKTLELYPADYVIKKGHRLGVIIGANDSLYLPTPSGQTVTVTGGTLSAPYLTYLRTTTLPGKKSTDSGTRTRITVPAASLAAAPTSWDEPPALVAAP